MESIIPETNKSPKKIPIFPGKCHQNGGCSMAMLVYKGVYPCVFFPVDHLFSPLGPSSSGASHCSFGSNQGGQCLSFDFLGGYITGQISSRPHTGPSPQMVVNSKGKSPKISGKPIGW